MDSEDGLFYYHDGVREKINLSEVLKTAESVCSVLGFKLDKTWEAYVAEELPKFPWTSIYLTSLQLSQGQDPASRILYALCYGPNGLKSKDYDCDVEMHPLEVECPTNIVRKGEELMAIDYVINKIQNAFCFF